MAELRCTRCGETDAHEHLTPREATTFLWHITIHRSHIDTLHNDGGVTRCDACGREWRGHDYRREVARGWWMLGKFASGPLKEQRVVVRQIMRWCTRCKWTGLA